METFQDIVGWSYNRWNQTLKVLDSTGHSKEFYCPNSSKFNFEDTVYYCYAENMEAHRNYGIDSIQYKENPYEVENLDIKYVVVSIWFTANKQNSMTS